MPKICKMGSKSRSARILANPSSAVVYTRLPNDSSASIAGSTQTDHPQNVNPNDGKYQPPGEDTLCQDEEEYDGEEEERRQDGVRQAEAITSVWTFRVLILTYFLYVGFPESLECLE